MSRERLAQDLDELLRRCVQCGLCLPHCATWQATGSEVQSPRGRLLLLGEASRQGAAEPAFLEAFDLCIGCRACETACPSGVPFSLLERGQAMATAAGVPAAGLPKSLLRRLDERPFLAMLGRVARAMSAGLRFLLGPDWRRRLGGRRVARLLGSVPRAPKSDAALVAQLDRLTGRSGPWRPPPRAGSGAGPVAFFRGCANDALLPASANRLRALLRAAGHDIVEPPGQDCCGALAAHTGRPGRAADLRRRNRRAFATVAPGPPIVVEAAGCGLTLAGYGEAWSTRVRDAACLLADATLPPLARLDLKVAIHDPCHARHGRGIVAEPRMLLRRIPGVEVLEPAEAEVCCGAGGAWSLRHPDLAEELGRRKADLLAATGADLVVTGNPGCLGQIADGLAVGADRLPILPLTDLLWYAAARAESCASENVSDIGS